MKYFFIGLLIFVIMVIYIYRIPQVEGLDTFNGRMAVDDQYYYDQVFDDVIYYPNIYAGEKDTSEEFGKLLKTGWMTCIEKCPDKCIEFGVTGNSYCLPY